VSKPILYDPSLTPGPKATMGSEGVMLTQGVCHSDVSASSASGTRARTSSLSQGLLNDLEGVLRRRRQSHDAG